MLSPPEVSIRTSVVGLAVMLGTIALVWSWMLGWATLVGFGGLGLFFVRGGGGIARRQTGVAFGVSLCVLAVKYGLLFGGIERPRWGRTGSRCCSCSRWCGRSSSRGVRVPAPYARPERMSLLRERSLPLPRVRCEEFLRHTPVQANPRYCCH